MDRELSNLDLDAEALPPSRPKPKIDDPRVRNPLPEFVLDIWCPIVDPELDFFFKCRCVFFARPSTLKFLFATIDEDDDPEEIADDNSEDDLDMDLASLVQCEDDDILFG
jgi:hypothetical protein